MPRAAVYGGDRMLLETIEAEDAAERQRDPAGYALRWSPGVQDSLARAAHEGQTNAELAQLRADELWEAQAALGIAEARRRPWTLEESQALARQWLAAEARPAGLARGEALVGLLNERVMTLPSDQRAGALAALQRQGLDARTPGRLRATVAALEQGAMATAYRAAEAPLVQLADSGQIGNDADSVGALQTAQGFTEPCFGGALFLWALTLEEPSALADRGAGEAVFAAREGGVDPAEIATALRLRLYPPSNLPELVRLAFDLSAAMKNVGGRPSRRRFHLTDRTVFGYK